MRRILDGLYLLESGRFVNSYLIEGSLGLTLVDAGHSRCGEALLSELKDGGFRLEDLSQVLLTHAHPDHAGGLPALLKRRRVKVLAHPADIPALEGREPFPGHPGLWGRLLGAYYGLGYKAEPLERVAALKPGEPLWSLARWQVLHTPGHTSGSLSLYDPARAVLLCGDVFAARRGALKWSVADPDAPEARESLRALSSLAIETLAPGHGPVIREKGALRIDELARSLGLGGA